MVEEHEGHSTTTTTLTLILILATEIGGGTPPICTPPLVAVVNRDW